MSTSISRIDALKNAWLNAGSHPEYHVRKMMELEEDWPMLADAIKEIVKND